MVFFGFAVIGKFSEIALWLRISRVSQPKKTPQICRENCAILKKLQNSTNSKPTFHPPKKHLPKQFLSVYDFRSFH